MLQWKSAWSICPQCRLRLLGASMSTRASSSRSMATATPALRSLRTRSQLWSSLPSSRSIATSSRRQNAQASPKEEIESQDHPPPPLQGEEDIETIQEDVNGQKEGYTAEIEGSESDGVRASPEEMARAARNFFGDSLPQGALSEDEFTIYKRMYGEPSAITTEHLQDKEDENNNLLLRDNEDGTVDEFEYVEEPSEDQVVDEDADLDEKEDVEVDNLSDDVALLKKQVAELELQKQLETEPEMALTFGEMTEDEPTSTSTSRSKDEMLEDIYDNWPDEEFVRSHPFTDAGKFGTKPSTLQLPKEAFVAPVQAMLANVSNKHLSEAAQKTLGGVGIPDSPSTPAIGRSKGQRPIPLTAMQSKMSPMDANVFVSSIMPQVYASAVSVLVECRKRMGSAWLRGLIEKEGGPLILDAGAGGAATIAFRELLRAEWESMQEDSETNTDEKQTRKVPTGKATVVTGSDSLRLKASSLLENTTFIPRLPDYVDQTEKETNAHQPRKRYDVIIAPHSLWQLTEEHERKARVQTLWSLLNPDGGLLVLIEKGVPRGFEVVAAARDLLLSKHIASPGGGSYENTLEERGSTSKGTEPKKERYTVKEKGSIIAPCTNHLPCPLYTTSGVSRGRKDWCHFQQRYTRPSYLMSVLQAKARNHDDVEFSYLAVQRGLDIRRKEDDQLLGQGFEQGDVATELAKVGYGPKRHPRDQDDVEDEPNEVSAPEEFASEGALPQPHPLTLPRIMPAPLKRKGHILLDVCTPSGTYERWMVRRGLGKQAFRDARKAKWGDLWALGASATEARRLRLGTPVAVVRMTTKRERERAKGWRKGRDGGKGKWQYGGSTAEQ